MAYKIADNIKITEFFSMFECIRQGGYNFKGEIHDFWECLYVQKGNVCVSGDERVYNMGEGELVFHKPLELHKYYVEEGSSAELFIFSFAMEGTLTQFFEQKCFKLNDNQKTVIKNILRFIDIKNSCYPENDFIYTKTLENLSKSNVHMQIMANFVCGLLLSICDSFDIVAETMNDESVVFSSAVKYMNENIGRSLGVSEIAEHCCISETGLKKIFAQIAGLGVHKYFLKLKINRAMKMLKEGNSVSDCAEMLGFSSQAYFSAAFKRETGTSPGEYKK